MSLKITKKSSLAPAVAGGSLDAGPSDGKPGIVLSFPAGASKDISELTEDWVADDFATRHSDNLRYDHTLGKWFIWSNTHWKEDGTKLAFHYARELCRLHRGGQTRMASKKAAEGVEHMARADPQLSVTAEIWDRNPLLLGTPGGTVDLKTGKLNEAKRDDYITKLTSVVPATEGTPCPTFSKFLSEATGGDQALERFLQQYAGYCLTGVTTEQALVFIYGAGGNGKSVLQTVISEIAGEYAKTAAMETFAATRNTRHLTELAMLHGARIVGVSETEKGQAWAESRINQLTGGDPVTANFMRRDHFTFTPVFKFIIVGNYKPQLGSVNDAARRRFNIVPFLHKPTKPDRALVTKLRTEYAGILRWMIAGCLDWQANGLVRPDAVLQATEDYFDEQDLVGQWIASGCEVGADKKASASTLFNSWKAFALDHGEQPGSSKTFGSALTQRGHSKTKSCVTMYLGIQPKSPPNSNALGSEVKG
ncbi:MULTISPECIES: phage/plasmid primase, P4 family [unclassified Mesorhizobium]|uniref:phage/plasmid primase, P4 family n=1 Tax=unclassified Mesorhizobium TaxID=325217 RepID=UPI0033354FD5